MKRILSIILCMCMLFSNGTISIISGAMDLIPEPLEASPKVEVTLDGETVNELSMDVYDKKIVSAKVQDITVQGYQWQILMDARKAVWVNIYDKTGSDCEISYTVLDGMLDESNCAYVRCKVSSSNSYAYYSDPVKVKIEAVCEEVRTEEDMGMFSLISGTRNSDDESSLVTVTINYLDYNAYNKDDTKKKIFTSYVAQIVSGTEFKQTIISPTFLGYAPFYDPDDPESLDNSRKGNITTPASEIILNESSVTENITIDVFYKPIAVNYAISYYFQNIHDDMYTHDASRYYTGKAETGTIINNDDINSHVGDVKGFSLMYHIPDAVAADGSTVFECYYDREYFLLLFDNDGGYGADPIYARYGTPFVVNIPARYGYIFMGWDELTEDTNLDGIPDSGDGIPDTIDTTIQALYDSNGQKIDKYYKALWQAEDTTYTVAYWAYDEDGRVYYLHSKQLPSATGATVTGVDDLGEYLRCTKPEHTHTSLCSCVLSVHQHSASCCMIEEHAHDGTCNIICDHQHQASCMLYVSNETLGDGDRNAINAVSKSGPEVGYAYLIQSSTDASYSNQRYWLKCYLGTNEYGMEIWVKADYLYDTSSDPQSDVDTYVDRTATPVSGTAGGLTAIKYPLNPGIFRCGHHDLAGCYDCGKASHAHSDGSCYCDTPAHTHGTNCKYSCVEHTHTADCTGHTTFLKFLSAETKEVKGDGSTVVNVYYTHKNYTLRFYYARSSVQNGETVYEVVGGSTYNFGSPKNTNPKTSIETALENVPESDWGKVTQPTINSSYLNQKFTKDGIEYNYFHQGSVTYTKLVDTSNVAYTYYYFEFTAPFESDITNLWPVDMFDPVTILETHSTHQPDSSGGTYCKYGDQAYFSAWNGEDRVKYTQSHSNATIKGLYTVLDDDLIFNSAYKNEEVAYIDHNGVESSLVSYLCFWENGANVSWSVPKLFQYYIYLRLLPAELEALGPLDDSNLPENIIKKNGNYYRMANVLSVYDDSGLSDQTRAAIVGYEYNASLYYDETINDGSDGSMKHYKLHYFYDRLSTTQLIYNNYGTVVSEKSGAVDYAEDISDGYFVPDYPLKLEPNAYVFDGWYTTSECLPGSEFSFENARMPANDLTLYAKWIPTEHNVTFFLTLDDMKEYLAGEAGNGDLVLYRIENIVHGNVVGSIETPTNADKGIELVFEGWFYLENGVKKAFHPLSMPIKKDMNIFASWGSKTTQPYMIKYVLKDDPDVEVAARTTGFAFTGSTRTFQAKTGNPHNQLYEPYANGYFPTVASHSITIQHEDDHANPQNNVFTFYYVKAQDISYTVNYLDKETGLPIAPSKTSTTTASVVTERFVAVEDMVPDAFYKRLVIAVEEKNGVIVGSDTNVIDFYYTKNVKSAFYAVHFMVQKQGNEYAGGTNFALDGSGDYEEYGSHIEGVADVGSTVEISPETIAGFYCYHKATKLQGEVQSSVNISGGTFSIDITEGGTELYVFYKRESYSYKVNYYLYNSTTFVDAQNYPTVTDTSPYGSVIEVTAPVMNGYTCVNADENAEKEGVQLYLEIKNNTDANNATINDLIFYYAPKQFTIEYYQVPEAGGTISTTIEVLIGSSIPVGSTAAAKENYRLDGWYKDAACTIPVTADDGTLTRNENGSITFVPGKDSLSETESNRFYAKYIPLVGDLTIIRSGAASDDQVFVYTITNNLTGVSMNATIVGNASVTIKNVPLGEYTIMQDATWSWRYDGEILVQTISNVQGTTVQFAGSPINDHWLNGNSEIIVHG